MEDIIAQVLSVIIFGGLGVMAVTLTLKKSRGHKNRLKASKHRGWEYQAVSKTINYVAGESSDSPDRAVLYRLRGTLNDAASWLIESRFRHTRGDSGVATEKSTFWQCQTAATPGLYIHIMAKTSPGVTIIGGDKEAELQNLTLEQGRYSLGRELRRFGVSSADGILETVQQLAIGSENWQEKFNLFSSEEEAAKCILENKLLSALLDWVGKYKQAEYPVITFCPQGVQVTLQWTVENIETLDQLVALGEIVLQSQVECRDRTVLL